MKPASKGKKGRFIGLLDVGTTSATTEELSHEKVVEARIAALKLKYGSVIANLKKKKGGRGASGSSNVSNSSGNASPSAPMKGRGVDGPTDDGTGSVVNDKKGAVDDSFADDRDTEKSKEMPPMKTWGDECIPPPSGIKIKNDISTQYCFPRRRISI